MQPGVTVALAMVWLAGLVGVLSTSTPPPPFVDQYSPQLPENRHGVGRRPEVLANRKLWRTLQDRTEAPIHDNSNDLSLQKFAPTELPPASFSNGTLDDYRDKVWESSNSVVYIKKSAESNTKVNEKKDEASAKKSVNVIEKTSTSEVPELGIDFTIGRTGERKKRSGKLSLENRYFVPDADPLVAIEFGTEEEDENEDGQYYEEIDELLRLRQEEKTRGQSKAEQQTRGDIPVTEEDSSVSGTSDVPLRGDIGVANARAIADSSRLVEATKKPRSIETSGASASFIDVTASNGSRRIAKRETIDFSHKMKSSWGYAGKGADPRRKKPKGDEYKKKNDTIKNLKRNQNNRWKLDNRSQKKNLMGSRDRYRTRPSREEEALLEKKLQDYIRRNTPIDVRRNRHLYGSFNYDHRRRDDNRDFYPNTNNRRAQVPDDNQPRDQWGRQTPRVRHEPQQFHDPRQIHDARHHDPRLNHRPNISQGTSQNYDPSLPHDPRYIYRQRPSHDPRQRGSTEGHIERTPLNNNASYQPNYQQPFNHNIRHRHGQQSPTAHDPRQPHDPRYQDPRQRTDPRQNYDQRRRNDPRYQTQETHQEHDQRQRNDPRYNQSPRRPNDLEESNRGSDRNLENNRSTPPAENVRRLSTTDNNRVDDYVRRNTPVDVRQQPNRGLVRPYQTGVDTSHSVSGGAKGKDIYEKNKPRKTPSSFLIPVDGDSQRERNFKAPNVSLDQRLRNRPYDQHPYKQPPQNEHQDRWRHHEFLGYEQEPEISQSGTPEHETRYQEFRGNPGSIKTADYDRYRHAQVGARIYITPSVFQNRYKRDDIYARIDPHHKGPVASRFPVPATKKPPVEGPSLCVWAVIKCCPNSARRKNCFEAHGCPGISWDPDPCRKSVTDAARDEIQHFYTMSEDVY